LSGTLGPLGPEAAGHRHVRTTDPVEGAMLVVTRKNGEQLVIGDNIVVTVLKIEGDRVRLGIAAPREVPVHRMEVFEAIHSRTQTSPPISQPTSA
jgi:carbon storage regulator